MGWYEPTSTFPRRDGRDPRDTQAGMVALQVATLAKLRSSTPTATQELELQDAEPAQRYNREQRDGQFIESLAGSLDELYRSDGDFVRRYGPSSEFLADLRIDGTFDADAASAALQAQIEEEFPNAAARMEGGFEGAQALAIDMRNAAERSAEDHERSTDTWGAIAAWIEFIRRLSAPRQENIERMIELFAPQEGPALFSPALVDFSGWLNEEPRSSIESQIDAMDALQQEATVPVHMLVPFNPWRQMLWDRDGIGASPLALVENALKKKGAIGVKLYPPMGFLPLGNATVNPLLVYQRRADNYEPGFRDGIDDALLRLYKLCAELGAPVLAHASSGNGAGPDFGRRARPENWRTVLAHPDLQKLRICLAHFGGYEAQPKDLPNPAVWELEAAKLIDDFPGRVFVDTAFISVVLPGYDNTPEQDVAVAGLMAAASPPPTGSKNLATQLVYGSDWHMLAQVPGNGEYPAAVRRHVKKTPLASEVQAVFVRNAVRLFDLGATPEGAGYKRLKQYYADHANRPALDFARITALSAV